MASELLAPGWIGFLSIFNILLFIAIIALVFMALFYLSGWHIWELKL